MLHAALQYLPMMHLKNSIEWRLYSTDLVHVLGKGESTCAWQASSPSIHVASWLRVNGETHDALFSLAAPKYYVGEWRS